MDDHTNTFLGGNELTEDVGAPDITVLRVIRDLFLNEEPLVGETSFDSILDPQELCVRFTDGIADASWCRLEITWYRTGAYRFHYIDKNGRNWRFDRHPNDHSPEKHFHEPPDADSETARQSCIRVEEPRLVARAVLNLWRRAYETDSFADLNSAQNPP